MEMHESCPLPDQAKTPGSPLQRMLAARRIAIVGLSDDPGRPSHGVARYLMSAGKEIIPVNPVHETVLGLRSFASLEDIPGQVDLVDVFRRPQYCPDVVRSAIKIGVKGVWLQSGITSAESENLAREAGIDFVQDKCLKVELMYQR
jgi:hypothetical protein